MLDRIKQYSTTEGTGAYTLGSAVPGFRTIDTAIAVDGHLGAPLPAVPYIATMGDEWEVGYGVYGRSGAGTLDRTVIASSTVGDDLVNWGAGSKEIAIGPLALSGFNGARGNVATFAPGSSNNISEGYRPGSTWVQLDEIDPINNPPVGFHICVDATAFAAVWVNLKGLAGADLSVVGNLDMLKRSGKGLYIVNNTVDEDTITWPQPALAAFDPVNNATTMAARAGRLHKGAWTEEDISGAQAIFWVPRGAGIITGTVVACVDTNVAANNKGAAWTIQAVYRHDSAGELVWIGTPTITLIQGDAELSGVVLALNDGPLAEPEGFSISVDGVALLNITWSFDLRINQVFERGGGGF